MSGRAAGRAGGAVVAFAVLVGVASFVVRVREAATIEAYVDAVEEASISGDAVNAGLVLAAVGVGALGTLIVRRLPRNVIGWVFLATALVMPVGGFSEAYSVWSHAEVWSGGRSAPLPAAGLADAFYESGGGVFWAPLFALMLFFPDGRPPPGRWRWLVPVVAVVLAGFLLEPLFSLGVGDILWAAQMPVLVLSAAALVARFRRAHGIERQQLRWIAASGTLVILGAVLLFATGAANDGVGTELWMLIGPAFVVTGFVSMPIAATVAIIRYRLYDLDRLVSRASTYVASVALVAGVYAGSVLAVRAALPAARGSDLTVAVSTLLAAAAFSPVQRRVRQVIDRRFHRQRYDAARALEQLGSGLRDEVDESALVRAVEQTLVRTLKPAHVSVWLPS